MGTGTTSTGHPTPAWRNDFAVISQAVTINEARLATRAQFCRVSQPKSRSGMRGNSQNGKRIVGTAGVK